MGVFGRFGRGSCTESWQDVTTALDDAACCVFIFPRHRSRINCKYHDSQGLVNLGMGLAKKEVVMSQNPIIFPDRKYSGSTGKEPTGSNARNCEKPHQIASIQPSNPRPHGRDG